MAISEVQLERWSHRGPTAQFTSTYGVLKGVLDSGQAPYSGRSCDTFLQGSYRNDTNVYGDSDVDIVIRTRAVYYSDTSNLSADEKGNFNRDFSPATYELSDFKAEVIAWLQRHYGDAVTPGPKAIKIRGNGSRRDADVLVAAEFRRFRQFRSASDQSYEEVSASSCPTTPASRTFPSSTRTIAPPNIRTRASGSSHPCASTRISGMR